MRWFLEPERRQLREDLALVGNAGAKNVIEGRDSIRGDHQQRVAEIEDVADLALPVRNKAAQPCFVGSSRGTRFPGRPAILPGRVGGRRHAQEERHSPMIGLIYCVSFPGL